MGEAGQGVQGLTGTYCAQWPPGRSTASNEVEILGVHSHDKNLGLDLIRCRESGSAPSCGLQLPLLPQPSLPQVSDALNATPQEGRLLESILKACRPCVFSLHDGQVTHVCASDFAG